MNIYLVSGEYTRSNNEIGTYLINLFTRLAEMGHNVHMITTFEIRKGFLYCAKQYRKFWEKSKNEDKL